MSLTRKWTMHRPRRGADGRRQGAFPRRVCEEVPITSGGAQHRSVCQGGGRRQPHRRRGGGLRHACMRPGHEAQAPCRAMRERHACGASGPLQPPPPLRMHAVPTMRRGPKPSHTYAPHTPLLRAAAQLPVTQALAQGGKGLGLGRREEPLNHCDRSIGGSTGLQVIGNYIWGREAACARAHIAPGGTIAQTLCLHFHQQVWRQ
jgi:hypothetical protein